MVLEWGKGLVTRDLRFFRFAYNNAIAFDFDDCNGGVLGEVVAFGGYADAEVVKKACATGAEVREGCTRSA